MIQELRSIVKGGFYNGRLYMNVTRASITIFIDDTEGVVWLAKDKTK